MARWNIGTVGVISTGGGLEGAFAAGVLEAFEAEELPISFFEGVSVGALTGAQFVADGCKIAGVKENLLLIEKNLGFGFLFPDSWLDRFSKLWGRKRSSLFPGDGLKALVYGKEGIYNKKKFKITGIDAEKLVESPIHTIIGVHWEQKRKKRVYEIISNHDPRFRKDPKAILPFLVASGSPQGFLPAHRIDEKVYSDGLYPKIKPPFKIDCERCRIQSCNTVFLILNDQPDDGGEIGDEPCDERLRIPFDIMHDKELILAAQRASDLHLELRIHAMGSSLPVVEEFARKEEPVLQYDGQGKPLHKILAVISPTEKIGALSNFFFKLGDVSAGMALGYKCGKAVLAKFRALQAPIQDKQAT